MRKVLCIITVCFMIIAMFSGCTVLQKLGLQKNDSEELHPVSSIVMNEDEAKKLTDMVPIHLYFANEDNTKLKLEVRYIPMTEAKKSVNNLASTIVKELINGPKDSGLKATVPAGTQLRAPVAINAGVATVDLSKEFIDKHPGGKDAEQMTIYSVVNSLTELKEIQKVKFTINGKQQKEFKGSFKFDSPFPRSAGIISKDTAKPNTVTPDKTADPKKQETDKKKTDDKTKTDDKSKIGSQKGTDSNQKPNDKSSSADLAGDAEETYLEILE